MLSTAHRSIFVHVPKAAGQSVEMAFLDDLGLGSAERAPLLLRYNPDRAIGPERLAHLYAWEYPALGHVTSEQFDAFFKFAVVRDPYERAVSELKYRGLSKRLGVRDYFRGVPDDAYDVRRRHIDPQRCYLTDRSGERLLVDEVLRFETLEDDWRRVSERVFGRAVRLPHRNRGRSSVTAADLSRADLDFLGEFYEADFHLFGYARR